MNKDILVGRWKQLRGKVQQRWGQLTDDDLEQINGKREQLAGLLRENYGYGRGRARQEIGQFLKKVHIK
jgi:uncharacterized protein YjbJ (UPF0337 family)